MYAAFKKFEKGGCSFILPGVTAPDRHDANFWFLLSNLCLNELISWKLFWYMAVNKI